jgi:hypothetical protein
MPPASYSKSLALANSLIASARYPTELVSLIEADIAKTLPQVKVFLPGAPMYYDLRNLLLAYSVFWKEKPSYVRLSSSCTML